MPNPFPHLHQKLRALVRAIVGVFLIIISLVIILTQFTELSAKNENLSLAVVFFLVSTLCLLQAIKEVEWDTK